jgi:hypothetical protein
VQVYGPRPGLGNKYSCESSSSQLHVAVPTLRFCPLTKIIAARETMNVTAGKTIVVIDNALDVVALFPFYTAR